LGEENRRKKGKKMGDVLIDVRKKGEERKKKKKKNERNDKLGTSWPVNAIKIELLQNLSNFHLTKTADWTCPQIGLIL
jgi:hypothetical protein